MPENKVIKLTRQHYASDVPVFTGRPQGRIVRAEFNLDSLDRDKNTYDVHIPKGTLGFNASFYLGLFYPSYKTLEPDGFHAKYNMVYLEDDPILLQVLKDNITECDIDALNEYSGKSGLDF